MACSDTRKNCATASVFAAVASPQCGQFMNPANFMAEQLIYDVSFRDLINNFGIPIDYYINTFNLSAADTLYGEQPTAVFYGPVPLMMYVELTENAINLTKFGFDSGDEMTGYLHIQTFEETMTGKDFYIQMSSGDILAYEDYITFIQTQSGQNIDTQLLSDIVTEDSEIAVLDILGGDYAAYNKYFDNGQSIEPKSGDLIQLSPLGCDRPNGRGAKIFEVTERTDEDISAINPLLGHYVYRLRAKRYEYSFEPGAPQEPVNQQVFENSFSGKISSTLGQAVSEPKSYPGDIDTLSKEVVFDMTANDTDIYGTYY